MALLSWAHKNHAAPSRRVSQVQKWIIWKQKKDILLYLVTSALCLYVGAFVWFLSCCKMLQFASLLSQPQKRKTKKNSLFQARFVLNTVTFPIWTRLDGFTKAHNMMKVNHSHKLLCGGIHFFFLTLKNSILSMSVYLCCLHRIALAQLKTLLCFWKNMTV